MVSVWRGVLLLVLSLISFPAMAQIPEHRVLVLFNSQNAESLAVRDAYVAAHPGVLEFDVNTPGLNPGAINRATYLSVIRSPLLTHLNSTVGQGMMLSEQDESGPVSLESPGRRRRPNLT